VHEDLAILLLDPRRLGIEDKANAFRFQRSL
jgi:hypothetical protein